MVDIMRHYLDDCEHKHSFWEPCMPPRDCSKGYHDCKPSGISMGRTTHLRCKCGYEVSVSDLMRQAHENMLKDLDKMGTQNPESDPKAPPIPDGSP